MADCSFFKFNLTLILFNLNVLISTALQLISLWAADASPKSNYYQQALRKVLGAITREIINLNDKRHPQSVNLPLLSEAGLLPGLASNWEWTRRESISAAQLIYSNFYRSHFRPEEQVNQKSTECTLKSTKTNIKGILLSCVPRTSSHPAGSMLLQLLILLLVGSSEHWKSCRGITWSLTTRILN